MCWNVPVYVTELYRIALASFPGPIISMRRWWNPPWLRACMNGPFFLLLFGPGNKAKYYIYWGLGVVYLYICSDRNLEMGDKSSGYWEACFQLREPCPKFLQPMVDKVSYIRTYTAPHADMDEVLTRLMFPGSCSQAHVPRLMSPGSCPQASF